MKAVLKWLRTLGVGHVRSGPVANAKSVAADKSLNDEVVRRLIGRRSLKGLPLGTVDGRIDLRGLRIEDPEILGVFDTSFGRATGLDVQRVQGARWKNLDLSGSYLSSLRLYECRIENCVFDDSICPDLRMWATQVTDCSFRRANLREASFGGAIGNSFSVFTNVDFTSANLREVMSAVARFDRCLFRNARLEKIDFQGSIFVDCIFEGLLSDVMFYKHGYKGGHFPPNEMKGLDFRNAELRDVGFRNLRLDTIKPPSNDKHILIKNVGLNLRHIIAALESHGNADTLKLAQFLRGGLKWTPEHQVWGIIHRKAFIETFGAAAVAKLEAILPVVH